MRALTGSVSNRRIAQRRDRLTDLGAVLRLEDEGDALGERAAVGVELRAEVLGVVREDPRLGVEAVLPLPCACM